MIPAQTIHREISGLLGYFEVVVTAVAQQDTSLPVSFRLVGAAAVVALGVCVMHYIGMSAQRLNADMTLDPLVIFASTTIAWTASLAALLMMLHLQVGWEARIPWRELALCLNNPRVTAGAGRFECDVDNLIVFAC